MIKYSKEDNITVFKKLDKVNIDEIKEGTVVYLKVKSPLRYGISWVAYYGKIIKKTTNFFDIIEYFNSLDVIDNCKTEMVIRKNNNPKMNTKRWAKKSIIELYTCSMTEKVVTQEYYKSE